MVVVWLHCFFLRRDDGVKDCFLSLLLSLEVLAFVGAGVLLL